MRKKENSMLRNFARCQLKKNVISYLESSSKKKLKSVFFPDIVKLICPFVKVSLWIVAMTKRLTRIFNILVYMFTKCSEAFSLVYLVKVKTQFCFFTPIRWPVMLIRRPVAKRSNCFQFGSHKVLWLYASCDNILFQQRLHALLHC